MASSVRSFTPLAGLLALVPTAMAGFDATSSSNIAVYWGQNSYGQASGDLAQQSLATYCANTDIDIIPLAFANGITPAINNFASASNACTAFADNANLLDCPDIEADIKTCQDTYSKTILISLGGATYTQGGWSSTSDAEAAATSVFNMYGPDSGSGIDRPFGSAVVNGFDFDFEATTNNLPAFGAKLRDLMDTNQSNGGKQMYLSAAPQCPFPDAAVGDTINAVYMDFIMIQFYNNYCGVTNFVEGSDTQTAYNFDVWDDWAKNTSPNPDVSVMVGIPANTGAGGGYTEGSKLASAITWSEQYSSFGGVMMWDMSQLYANTGFLDEVTGDLA